MKWLRWSAILLAALLALSAVLAAAVLFYTYLFIRTPPVAQPEKPLLSWLADPLLPPAHQAPWEQAARAHQVAQIQLDQFMTPALKFGPWTRWWWPGNLVEAPELRRELKLFSEVGIAGVEIQPFAISISDKDKASSRWHTRGWDSAEYYQNLQLVMQEAQSRGMGVDLNNGSGWPTGGPHVALEDGMRQLLYSELLVRGPTTIRQRLAAPAMPLATFGAGALGMLGDTPMQTFVPEERELVAVVAARIVDNQRSWQPWDFLDQIELDAGTVQEITEQVDGDQLVWNVPAGEWAITSLWQLPGGELISGGYAHPQPGYVVDHLDGARMRANQDYLFRAETGLNRWFGAPLRAFFNDSLEFRQERHWAMGHLQEFAARKNYDPGPWLAALIEPGKDQMPFHAANIATAPVYDLGEKGLRFLEDWDEVTSDLFRERYFQPLKSWARERGLAHRLQGYGGPMDIIRAAGESDIPEAEQLYAGGSEMFIKAVSSGGHIHGRPIISAESFVFVGRAFMTTPVKIKALADKAFAAGINQLVYHGSAYRIEDHAARGYPADDGWYPWQLGMISTDYSEHWPYWQYAGQLNRYIARNQYLLQMGAPETDVLVLYPGLGFPQGYGNPQEPFDQGRFEGEETLADTGDSADDGAGRSEGHGEVERMRATWHITRELERKGLSWEWVNEHSLAQASFEDGVLRVGGLRASALLLHDIEALQVQTAERIAALVARGMPLSIEGPAPVRQRGLKDAANGDNRVRAALSEAQALASTVFPTAPLRFENSQVKFIRRRLANGDLVQLFTNPWPREAVLSLVVGEPHSQLLWLDAWAGTVYNAALGSQRQLTVTLPAYGSKLLWLRKQGVNNRPDPPLFEPVHKRLLERWSMKMADGSYESEGGLVGDWLKLPELRNSAGPGIYTNHFVAPADIEARLLQGHRYRLELGKVYGAARITLNGLPLGAALLPPYAIDLTPVIRAGENQLTVTVTPARKNSLVTAIENGEPGWNAPNMIGTSERVSAGLLGPVSLTEQVPTVRP